jgi:hypothetical protein
MPICVIIANICGVLRTFNSVEVTMLFWFPTYFVVLIDARASRRLRRRLAFAAALIKFRRTGEVFFCIRMSLCLQVGQS